jgi:hypothetical protein
VRCRRPCSRPRREFTIDAPRRHVHPPTRWRELGGVGEQVEDNLLEFPFVGADAVDGWVDLQVQCHPPAQRLLADDGRATLQRLADREGGRDQVHPTGLHFREVEDVIDQRQEVAPGGADVGQVLDLLVIQRP